MPLYLGDTKIDKFTAKIEGGAASLEGNLTVITPPTKLVYDVGDSFDPRGMKVVATIGGLEVPVGSYTVSPDPLVAGTTEVVLTYELDGKTATGTQSITVNEADTILENNSWDIIALIAEQGMAENYWNVGDSKTFIYNNTTYTAKIVSFNHYDLATDDSKYSTTYNKSTNKSAITFLIFSNMGSEKMNFSDTTWNNTSMYKTTLPAKLLWLPENLQNALRTVQYSAYYSRNSPRNYTGKFFLPGKYEIQADSSNEYPKEKRFTYYANGNAFGMSGGNGIWTRDRDSTDYWKVLEGLTGNSIANPNTNGYYYVHPIFNL